MLLTRPPLPFYITLFHYQRAFGSVGGAVKSVSAGCEEKSRLRILAERVIPGGDTAQGRIRAACPTSSDVASIACRHGRTRWRRRCCSRRCGIVERDIEAVGVVRSSRRRECLRKQSGSHNGKRYH